MAQTEELIQTDIGLLVVDPETGIVSFLSSCCHAPTVFGETLCSTCFNALDVRIGMVWMYDDVTVWTVRFHNLLRHDSMFSAHDSDDITVLVNYEMSKATRLVEGYRAPATPTARPIVFNRMRQAELPAADAAAQTVGMLFADQDSTGMLF